MAVRVGTIPLITLTLPSFAVWVNAPAKPQIRAAMMGTKVKITGIETLPERSKTTITMIVRKPIIVRRSIFYSSYKIRLVSVFCEIALATISAVYHISITDPPFKYSEAQFDLFLFVQLHKGTFGCIFIESL